MASSSSRIHATIAQVALTVGLLTVIGGGIAIYWMARPYEPPSGADIFAVVEGKWAWTTSDSGCTKEWHRITFSPDRTVMMIAASKPYEGADGKFDSVAVYDIEAHTPTWIRGAIRGETRLTDAGKPVVWDLVLRSEDRYVWHRTDWEPRGSTAAIRRCPP